MTDGTGGTDVMTHAIQVNTSIEVVECYKCAVPFGMPAGLLRQRRSDGEDFWCPNGHPQVFTKTDADRLREATEQLRRQEERLTSIRAEADQAWAEVSETKKALTTTRRSMGQLKRRIKHGVCPCCHRTFTDSALVRHIATKHPDFATEGSA